MNDNHVKRCSTCLHNHTDDKSCTECITCEADGKCFVTYRMWEPKDQFNDISKPSHYTEGRMYEPKDVIRDWGLNFNLGSAVKYISRAGRKGDMVEDLRKAKQFIDFEIQALEMGDAEKFWTPERIREFIFGNKEKIKEILQHWEDDLR